MTPYWRRLLLFGALAAGIGLLVLAIQRVDVRSVSQLSGLLGMGLPLVLLPGAGWHLVRTEAWRRSFPKHLRLPFSRLFRVRLAAEAFSYLTISGVTGEPLKVLLLTPAVPPAVSTAATALERAAYMVVTAAVLSVTAAATAWVMPLTPQWSRVYTWIASVAGVLAFVPLSLVFFRRGPGRSVTAPHPATPVSPARTRVRRFLRESATYFRMLVTGDRRELAIVVGLEAAAFLMMTLEVFAALRLTGTPVTLPASIAIETFTRVASMLSAFIPANLGAMEVSNIAAAGALHVAAGGVALALVRRLRGLAWCAAGFLVFPRGLRRGNRGAAAPATAGRADDTLAVIQDNDSDAMVGAALGGMPVGERIARAAARAGYRRLIVWTSKRRAAEWISASRAVGGRVGISAIDDPVQWRQTWMRLDPAATVTVLGPGIVAPPALLAAARDAQVAGDRPLAVVTGDDNQLSSGVLRAAVHDVAGVETFVQKITSPDTFGRPAETAAPGSPTLTLPVSTAADLARS
jgi:hypothetical protein